jgi:hypothetical protein
VFAQALARVAAALADVLETRTADTDEEDVDTRRQGSAE